MTLGKIVEKYLREHGISQRSFAKKCGMSSGYISMIVNGINPRSNTPIVPTLKSLNGIAKGMNVSLDDLLSQMDDSVVELDFGKSSGEDGRVREFVDLFLQLTDDQKSMIISSMRGIISNN